MAKFVGNDASLDEILKNFRNRDVSRWVGHASGPVRVLLFGNREKAVIVFALGGFQMPQHRELAKDLAATSPRCIGRRVMGLPELHAQIADGQNVSCVAKLPTGVFRG